MNVTDRAMGPLLMFQWQGELRAHVRATLTCILNLDLTLSNTLC